MMTPSLEQHTYINRIPASQAGIRLIFFVISVILTSILHPSEALGQQVSDLGKVLISVTDIEGNPLKDAVCRINGADGKTLAYSMSDSKGGISMQTPAGAFEIVITAMGYDPWECPMEGFPFGKNIKAVLFKKVNDLKEITIKAPVVRARGDTVVYRASAFLSPGDTHLADLLKKLPGVQVSDKGMVTYQGKPINKFYIEGKDLLGSSYGQATNNLPVGAVSEVEILENHQPVKMLRDKQAIDKAAINIRLSGKSKFRPFGEIEGRVGEKPLVWDNRLFLAEMGTKTQVMLTAAMSSMGEDLGANTRDMIQAGDVDAYQPTPPGVLTLSDFGLIPIDKKRFTFGKSWSAGLNFLTSTGQDGSLRTNILTHNLHTSSEINTNFLYGGLESVRIAEDNRKKSTDFTIKPVLTYQYNGQKVFVTNETKWEWSKLSVANNLLSNNRNVRETVKSRPTYIQNYFSGVIPAGSRLVTLKAFLRYFNRHESLNSQSEGAELYDISEGFATKAWRGMAKASTGWKIGKSNLSAMADFNWKSNSFRYGSTTDASAIKARIKPSWTWHITHAFDLSADAGVAYLRNAVSSYESDRREGKWAFNPGVSFRHVMSHEWSWNISASRSVDSYETPFLSDIPLRTSYRTLRIPDLTPRFIRTDRASFSLKYKSLINLLFANFHVSYADSRRETYTELTYTDSLTVVRVRSGRNHAQSLQADLSADKDFTEMGLSLKGRMNYSYSRSLTVQNSVTAYNNTNSAIAELYLLFKKLKWWGTDIDLMGQWMWETNSWRNSEVLFSLTAHGTMWFIPWRNVRFATACTHYLRDMGNGKHKNTTFLDVSADWSLSKAWAIGTGIRNILNNHSYDLHSVNGFNISSTEVAMRGREFFVKATWQF